MKTRPQATTIPNLSDEIQAAPDQTVSKTLYRDATVKVVLFSFAAGQELSEHTASVPAILQFLNGRAGVTLGAERVEATAGTFIHMPAHLPHSIVAESDTEMLLLLLQEGER